jgi:hypothetical protein
MSYIDPLDALDFVPRDVASFIRDEVGIPLGSDSIWEAMQSGELKSVRHGRTNKFSRRMVLEFIERRYGVPIDWDRARAVAKRDRAQVAVLEAGVS